MFNAWKTVLTCCFLHWILRTQMVGKNCLLSVLDSIDISLIDILWNVICGGCFFMCPLFLGLLFAFLGFFCLFLAFASGSVWNLPPVLSLLWRCLGVPSLWGGLVLWLPFVCRGLWHSIWRLFLFLVFSCRVFLCLPFRGWLGFGQRVCFLFFMLICFVECGLLRLFAGFCVFCGDGVGCLWWFYSTLVVQLLINCFWTKVYIFGRINQPLRE